MPFFNVEGKNLGNFQRIIELFTQKIVTKLSKIWVWDPGSGFRKKPIPDPGSGSATLGGGHTCWVERGRGVKSSEDVRHFRKLQMRAFYAERFLPSSANIFQADRKSEVGIRPKKGLLVYMEYQSLSSRINLVPSIVEDEYIEDAQCPLPNAHEVYVFVQMEKIRTKLL
jgi:hypothetical protein